MHHVISVDVDKPWSLLDHAATLMMAVVVVVADAVAVAIVEVAIMLAVMLAQCTTKLQGSSMVAALALM